MKTGSVIENRSSSLRGRFWTPASAEVGALRVCTPLVRRSSPSRSLRIEQPSSHQVQIRQRRSHFQAVQILRKASVAHLLESEYPLDHANGVLNLGAHARLGPVNSLDPLIDPLAPPITLIGEVSRPGSRFAHLLALASVGLVAPHPSLLAMQQVRQGQRIGHISRR